MTFSRDWRSYPPEFRTLIETGYLREVELPCQDPKDAARLRGKLYAFFGVLHKSVAKNPELVPLSNMARKCILSLRGSSVFIGPQDAHPDNLLVKQALAKLTGAPLPVEGLAPMSPEMAALFAKPLTPDEKAP